LLSVPVLSPFVPQYPDVTVSVLSLKGSEKGIAQLIDSRVVRIDSAENLYSEFQNIANQSSVIKDWRSALTAGELLLLDW
jgi:hypothetical protein